MNFNDNLLYLDTTDLKCPMLFVKFKQNLKKLKSNQKLKVLVSDSSGIKDIKRYLDKNHYFYTLSEKHPEVLEFCISKD